MLKCECDRCGKIIKFVDRKKVRGKTKMWIGESGWERDLCTECAEEFEKFMKEKNVYGRKKK